MYPTTPSELLQWDWPQYEPIAQELQSRPIDAGNVGAWLQDWSDWSAHLSEAFSRLQVAVSANTADTEAERAYQHFNDAIYPRAMQAEQELKQKLLASGLEPAGFGTALRNMRAEADLFREANLPLLAEERRLSTEYDKIIGAQAVTWQGEEQTVAQMRPLQQSADRAGRERAWRLVAERQLADRAALNDLWGRMLHLRGQLAANAGRASYRDYRWQELLRFDYTPADCRSFHAAIEEVAVPAARRILQRRKASLGVDRLRPWDLEVDPFNRPPLRPYQETRQLIAGVTSIFRRVDPALGAYFETMVSENLLDLENRKNKAPGGFCTSFAVARRPFIFMNGVGLHDDVQTLLHEGGHSFHVFESSPISLIQLQNVPMEFAEVASMGMEMLAGPYLARPAGGFYTPADAARARIEYLEGCLLFWPYMAVVDAFQHWAYENPALAADPHACDATWSGLWQRYMPEVDWSGLEDVRATGWQRKEHIFGYPLYYVEYGLALLGAAQVWHNALSDQPGAVAAYRRALALGGSVPLPDLFGVAGAHLAFDAATLNQAVALMETKIAELSV